MGKKYAFNLFGRLGSQDADTQTECGGKMFIRDQHLWRGGEETNLNWEKLEEALANPGGSSEEIIAHYSLGWLPGGSIDKESACNARNPSLIPESGRYLGEGNGIPLE